MLRQCVENNNAKGNYYRNGKCVERLSKVPLVLKPYFYSFLFLSSCLPFLQPTSSRRRYLPVVSLLPSELLVQHRAKVHSIRRYRTDSHAVSNNNCYTTDGVHCIEDANWKFKLKRAPIYPIRIPFASHPHATCTCNTTTRYVYRLKFSPVFSIHLPTTTANNCSLSQMLCSLRKPNSFVG